MRHLYDGEVLEVRKHVGFRLHADVTGQEEPMLAMTQLYNQTVFVLIPAGCGPHDVQVNTPLGCKSPKVMELCFP